MCVELSHQILTYLFENNNRAKYWHKKILLDYMLGWVGIVILMLYVVLKIAMFALSNFEKQESDSKNLPYTSIFLLYYIMYLVLF